MRVLSEDWLTAEEAAEVISAYNGRKISKAHVQVLARRGAIRMQRINLRAVAYHRDDCQRTVKPCSGTPGGRPRKQPV